MQEASQIPLHEFHPTTHKRIIVYEKKILNLYTQINITYL